MEKAFVVRKVAAQLYKTEASLDEALLETTELLREVMQARRDLNANSLFADEVNVKLMAAMQAVTEARTSMRGVHEELKEAGLRLGLRTTMGGIAGGLGTTTGLALTEDLRKREEDLRQVG